MSEVRPVSTDLLMETFPFEHLLDPLILEVLSIMDNEENPDPSGCLEDSDEVALRLACIGDEMDLCLRSPRLAWLPGMTMHSLGLALSCDQPVRWGVLGSLSDGFANLREYVARLWRSLSPRPWVCPAPAWEQVLLLLLVLLLLGGGLHLLLK
ncbi:PREDICTED: bcl-2-interacting killer [Propithecus coquereli]|uniref:BCL2 interacting killer n=1 Tax=Propithecus coquereli TaxID=379532 RepID=A0A2K6FM79_PROCO|nr:PREDICTED: bcl-2-interacting killer [Propithecus coquereli]